MSEVEKYRGIYSRPEQFKNYGHSNHGANAVRLLARWKAPSVLDVGCGFNEFIKLAMEKIPGLRGVGVDFACPGADQICDAKALPFGPKEFDVVTGFDMLEHLLPEEVDLVLDELARVSGRFIFSISYVASVNKWEGATLHPTVRCEEWWMTKLIRAGAMQISKSGRYIVGSWRKPLRIASEARVVMVGNGPDAIAKDRGELIDSHDEVIRFNNFQTEGYATKLGQKTTLWSAFFHERDQPIRHTRVFCPHENDKPPAQCAEFYNMAGHFFARLRTFVQRRALWASAFGRDVNPLLPSSGLLVLSYLLEVLDVQKVHLVGFDHFSKEKSSKHHYWMNKAFKQPKEHDARTEAGLFAELADAGRVIYL